MPAEAGAKRLAIGKPGQRIGDRAAVQFAFERALVLDRAQQAERALHFAPIAIDPAQAERIPAAAFLGIGILPARLDVHRKLEPALGLFALQHLFDEARERRLVFRRGEIRHMRHHQQPCQIMPQIRDVFRCEYDKAVCVQPYDNVTRSLLNKTVQHTAFHITQTHIHAELPPALATYPCLSAFNSASCKLTHNHPELNFPLLFRY